MTWKYTLKRRLSGPDGETIEVGSLGGFESEDVAIVEGHRDVERIFELETDTSKAIIIMVEASEEGLKGPTPPAR